MYNYRIVPSNEQAIIDEAVEFCKKPHGIDEILRHCKQDFDCLFMLHECSLFHTPKKLNFAIFTELVNKYCKMLDDFAIKIPSRPTIGPHYSEKKSLKKDEGEAYTYKDNPDSSMTKFTKIFFGIEYTKPIRNNNRGWMPSENNKDIMTEHKKLYDILYSYCYSCNRDLKKENNKLGNLAKPSIFRFDENCEGSYHAAFEHIRRELIYRLPADADRKKLEASILLDKHTSQMRSSAFSAVESLLHLSLTNKLPNGLNRSNFKSSNECQDKIYSYIIDRCEKYNYIKIKKEGRKNTNAFSINMDLQDIYTDSILYYAYIYFNNLPTCDYLDELKNFFIKSDDTIDNIFQLHGKYITAKNEFVQKSYQQKSTVSSSDSISYDDIEYFITNNIDDVISIISIDENVPKIKQAKFAKSHSKYMILFIHLYKRLFQRLDVPSINMDVLLDLLHLYFRLDQYGILIPTSSFGYNKSTPSKPVRIKTVMKYIEKELDIIEQHKKNSNHEYNNIYMRNVISETWLSAVMYMALNGITTSVFLKRLYATQALFYALLQMVPPITTQNSASVNLNEIRKKFSQELLGL